MVSSYSFDMNFVALMMIGVFVAIIFAVVLRAGWAGHPAFWFGGAAIAVMCFITFVRIQSRHEERQARAAARAAETETLERLSLESLTFTPDTVETHPSTALSPPDLHEPWTSSEVHTTKTWGVLFIALLIPFAVFAAVRLSGKLFGSRSDHHRSGSGWSWLAVGTVCFLVFGGWFTSVETSYVANPHSGDHVPTIQIGGSGHDVVRSKGSPSVGEVPMDELWERLNASQIPVSASTTSDLANAAEEQGDGPDSAPASAAQSDHDVDPERESSENAAADGSVASDERASDSQEAGSGNAPPFTASVTKTSAAPRPDWVSQPPRMVGGVQRVVIEAGPYSTLAECYTQLRADMREVVADHIGELVGEATADASPYVPELPSMGITDGYMIRELLTDQFVQDGEASFGLTKTAWGLVEFSDSQDHRLLESWKAYARRDRIQTTLLGAAGVLVVLSGAFALLRIDTWTRGYYTKRLFLGIPAAIIGFVLLVVAASH